MIYFLFRTHSCQVNFERLEDFNQKVLQIKLSNPETARSVLEDAKISNKEIDERRAQVIHQPKFKLTRTVFLPSVRNFRSTCDVILV